MLRVVTLLLAFLVASAACLAADASAVAAARPAVVYVLPVREEINTPTLYILRRGLKEAIDQRADAVVLDMNTPGGSTPNTSSMTRQS